MKKLQYQQPLCEELQVMPVIRVLYDSNNLGGGGLSGGGKDAAPARKLYL